MVDVEEMIKKFGASSEESRQAVLDAHSGVENIREWAIEWATHHIIFGELNDIYVAYATAVDLGYRIGKGDK